MARITIEVPDEEVTKRGLSYWLEFVAEVWDVADGCYDGAHYVDSE